MCSGGETERVAEEHLHRDSLPLPGPGRTASPWGARSSPLHEGAWGPPAGNGGVTPPGGFLTRVSSCGVGTEACRAGVPSSSPGRGGEQGTCTSGWRGGGDTSTCMCGYATRSGGGVSRWAIALWGIRYKARGF